jgi:group I intron endonuclease
MSAQTIYSIYKITNILNEKRYIGFTQDCYRRWKQHKNDSKRVDKQLYSAFRKYGLENFRFEVIYQSLEREHTLVEMEPFFINQFDSMSNGYNANQGGFNSNTEERRNQASERMRKNNPMSKLRTNSGTFKKNHKPKITKERNEKIRKSKIGEANHNFGKPETSMVLNKRACCLYCRKETNIGNISRWHKGC